jgi:hypothetical protein
VHEDGSLRQQYGRGNHLLTFKKECNNDLHQSEKVGRKPPSSLKEKLQKKGIFAQKDDSA